MCGCGRTSMPRPGSNSAGPMWSTNTNGPTLRASRLGTARRTWKPPRSWLRGAMVVVIGKLLVVDRNASTEVRQQRAAQPQPARHPGADQRHHDGQRQADAQEVAEPVLARAQDQQVAVVADWRQEGDHRAQ